MLECERLEEKLSCVTENIKIKPKKKIRELQVQEKLVSLEERVEEALDFRKNSINSKLLKRRGSTNSYMKMLNTKGKI
jgi:hypothetical protein